MSAVAAAPPINLITSRRFIAAFQTHRMMMLAAQLGGPKGFADGSFGSRVDGALARTFLTFLQHWSGAVTCPAC